MFSNHHLQDLQTSHTHTHFVWLNIWLKTSPCDFLPFILVKVLYLIWTQIEKKKKTQLSLSLSPSLLFWRNWMSCPERWTLTLSGQNKTRSNLQLVWYRDICDSINSTRLLHSRTHQQHFVLHPDSSWMQLEGELETLWCFSLHVWLFGGWFYWELTTEACSQKTGWVFTHLSF